MLGSVLNACIREFILYMYCFIIIFIINFHDKSSQNIDKNSKLKYNARNSMATNEIEASVGAPPNQRPPSSGEKHLYKSPIPSLTH